MRRTTLLVLLVLTAPIMTGAVAAAGPSRPSCNLVVDPAGDTQGVPSDALDIVSADVASDGRTLTAVIRVRDYSLVDPATPLGRGYVLGFVGAGLGETYLIARDDIGEPEPFGFGSGIQNRTRLGVASGSIDADRNEITISIATATLKAAGLGTLRRGGKLSQVTAMTTSVRVGAAASAGNFSQPSDEATGHRPYVVGTPSCAKVS